MDGKSQFETVDCSAQLVHWLRIVRVGTAVRGYASSDGKNWTGVAEIVHPRLGGAEIGLMAYHGDRAPSIAADFDSFICTRVPEP